MYATKRPYIVYENSKNSKLLALFNALDEADKDAIIAMTESLAEKCKNNMTQIAGSIGEGKSDKEQRIV